MDRIGGLEEILGFRSKMINVVSRFGLIWCVLIGHGPLCWWGGIATWKVQNNA
jgi:hypothetical protein